uniref:Conjugative relaxosome accessory transposon protein n=1 Tax=Klebsiella pneumoniae TaxID=573 RepID=A0A2P1BP02_KLEPN|nr:Conjugative relaxosome accessory transposon protein [Klebsiella pneumoniae]
MMKNINIMWNALSKNRLFDGNKELKEFIMTLTGTLIFGRTVKSRRCRHAPLTGSD